MSLFIGIEGVGLRSAVAVTADDAGRILSASRAIGEPISLHTTDRHLLRLRLATLLRQVVQGAGRTLNELQDATLCIGLTGVTFPFDAETDLPSEFARLQVQVRSLICTGDAEIAFASHTSSDSGSALLCHMGSTGFATTPRAAARYGGWGPAFGDGGSGYWIGREALRAVSEQHDQQDTLSTLWALIDEWLGSLKKTDYGDWMGAALEWRKRRAQYGQPGSRYDQRTALFAFSHAMSLQKQWQWRAIVSSLTIPVMQAWRLGDRVATRIVEEAACLLVSQYVGACRLLGTQGPLSPLVLYGGVLTHNERFADLVVSKIRHQTGTLPAIVTPRTQGTLRPALGALLFALGGSATGALRLPAPHLIDNLKQSHASAKWPELDND